MKITNLMIWVAFKNSQLSTLYFVKPNAKMNAEMHIEVLENMSTILKVINPIHVCTNFCGKPYRVKDAIASKIIVELKGINVNLFLFLVI